MSTTSPNQSSDSVKVNRACVDSITIFDVTEGELSEIESGDSSGWLFDVAIACASICVSFIVTLTTTNIANERLFYSYVILTCAVGIASVALFINWKILTGKRDNVIRRIRSRKKAPPMRKDGDPTSAEPELEA